MYNDSQTHCSKRVINISNWIHHLWMLIVFRQKTEELEMKKKWAPPLQLMCLLQTQRKKWGVVEMPTNNREPSYPLIIAPLIAPCCNATRWRPIKVPKAVKILIAFILLAASTCHFKGGIWTFVNKNLKATYRKSSKAWENNVIFVLCHDVRCLSLGNEPVFWDNALYHTKDQNWDSQCTFENVKAFPLDCWSS